MSNESITVHHVIARLNEALERDPKTITGVFNTRHVCNEKLAGHPTVQVFRNQHGLNEVGPLGIINMFFETMTVRGLPGWGQIMAGKDDEGNIVQFIHTNDWLTMQQEQKDG